MGVAVGYGWENWQMKICKVRILNLYLQCISLIEARYGLRGWDADIKERLLSANLAFRNLANSNLSQGCGNGR